MKTLFFLLSVCCPLFLQAQTDFLSIADSISNEGFRLEAKGNFIGAIGKYKQAEAVIKKNKLGKSFEALTSSWIGYAYYNSKNTTEALKFLKRSIHNFELDSNIIQLHYCMICYDIAIISYNDLKQPVDSLCLYAMKAGNAAYQFYEEDDPNLGRFFDLVGFCKAQNKELQDAKPIFLHAFDLLYNYRDSFPSDFIEVCGHLTSLYNSAERLYSLD